MLSIKADVDAAERMLSDIGRKQLPFATAMALNDTAADVKEREERGIEQEFDRPTPFTKRALYVRRATKSRLAAQVGVKPVQAEYLRLQVTGGVRRPKRRALVVPAGARLNRYGNLPKGALGRLGKRANVFATSQGKRRAAHLPPGIYQRTGGRAGGRVKMLVAFEPRASYAARWQFHPVAMRRARAVFFDHFVGRMRQAMATAK